MNEPAGATSAQVYRVRARNTATASENRIHDDQTAARYGFRGGLVPGVTVYGYMTVPVVASYGRAWFERGAMEVKLVQPVYEGDEVIVRAIIDTPSADVPATRATSTSEPSANALISKLSITAERDDGTVCAVATATLNEPRPVPPLADHPFAPLPADVARPTPTRESLVKGAVLGTLRERLNLQDESLLNRLDERLPIYRGPNPPAHPVALLELSNHVLMRNFKLGPWIHTASELVNYHAARATDVIEARALIADCFERKGHEFVVLDVLLAASDARPVQHVRHTAIYRPRFV